MDFSDAKRFAHHFDSASRDAWQKPEEVIRLMQVSPGMTVVDLGAGTGYFAEYLVNAVGSEGRVLALDVEPKMVDYLRDRAAKARWTTLDAETVPADDPKLAKGSADRILIVNTWHHISDRVPYAAKLSQALEPGGSVLVVDFTADSDIGPPAHHRLTPEQVEAELKAGGLTTSVLEETLPKQYVVRGQRK
jgi:ubiquinone/menaquinone biosynthesis C-methylase UbiE